MKKSVYILIVLVTIMAVIPSFGLQQDDEVLPLYDPTPRTAYAKHILLPDKYTTFIFDFVNTYVGKAGADKSEEWWHQKGPFLTLYKSKRSNEYCVILRRRSLLRGSCYYTYLGKYLLVSNDPYFESYVDDGDQLRIDYIEFQFVEDPIHWIFEEKEDSLYLTDKYTPYDGAWRLIK